MPKRSGAESGQGRAVRDAVGQDEPELARKAVLVIPRITRRAEKRVPADLPGSRSMQRAVGTSTAPSRRSLLVLKQTVLSKTFARIRINVSFEQVHVLAVVQTTIFGEPNHLVFSRLHYRAE